MTVGRGELETIATRGVTNLMVGGGGDARSRTLRPSTGRCSHEVLRLVALTFSSMAARLPALDQALVCAAGLRRFSSMASLVARSRSGPRLGGRLAAVTANGFPAWLSALDLTRLSARAACHTASAIGNAGALPRGNARQRRLRAVAPRRPAKETQYHLIATATHLTTH